MFGGTTAVTLFFISTLSNGQHLKENLKPAKRSLPLKRIKKVANTGKFELLTRHFLVL